MAYKEPHLDSNGAKALYVALSDMNAAVVKSTKKKKSSSGTGKKSTAKKTQAKGTDKKKSK